MKKAFYFGRGNSKRELIFIVIIGFILGLIVSNRLFKDKLIFEGIVVLFVIVVAVIMILGRSSINDYWFIEGDNIYYFSKNHPYKRLLLGIFFQSEKHLMEKINIKSIVNSEILWREKLLPRNAISMPICLLGININEGKQITLNIGLNPTGSTEAGEALNYLLDKGIMIKGASESFMECLLDPNQTLYNYFTTIKK